MTKENKTLKCSVQGTATSPQNLKKLIRELNREVSDLQKECEQARKEKFYYLFYISKLCSWYLPYYQQKNSIDSQDWEKLYKQSTEQSNIL